MRTWLCRGMLAATIVASALAVRAADAPTWKSKDIGGPGQAGSYKEEAGKFTVKGGGNDIWDPDDHFQFVYQELSGDVTVLAKVTSLDNTNEWAKAGVMIRETDDADSSFAMTAVTPGNKIHLQGRNGKGATCSNNEEGAGDAAPYWVKLERAGDTLTASCSTDGTTWTKIDQTEVKMAAKVMVGLCVTAHDDAQLATAVFESVKVTAGK